MEDPEVFAQTHALVLEWRRRGWVDGFRIDHPDGLLDPLGYFERLADAAFGTGRATGRRSTWRRSSPTASGCAPSGRWRARPATTSSTRPRRCFSRPAGYAEVERSYHRVIRQPLEFPAVARQGKRLVLESGLSGGRAASGRAAAQAGGPGSAAPRGADRRARPGHRGDDRGPAGLPHVRRRALRRCPGRGSAAARSGARRGAGPRRASAEALDLLAAALLGARRPMRAPALERFRLRFVQRFQQLSGPATAKGVEDTAFYVYTPLLSRNEVGGGPEAPLERAVARLPRRQRRSRRPRSRRAMLAVTTHDTKRTADVRARLDVLTELPDGVGGAALPLAAAQSCRTRRRVRGRRLPDPNTVQHLCPGHRRYLAARAAGPGRARRRCATARRATC